MPDLLHSLSFYLRACYERGKREDEENSGVKEEEEVEGASRPCVTV